MNKKSGILLVWILLFVGIYANAHAQLQDSQIDVVDLFSDFGNVSADILSMEPNYNYPFEYLSKQASVRFIEDDGGIRAIIDHLVRIKVYTDDSLELAKASLISIPYYDSDRMERIQNLEAMTHLPDGSIVRLQDAAVSTSQLNSRYNIMEFEMPETEEGVVLEYKYTINRRYIEELPDFYLSHRVPTREASITLQNERFLRYDVVLENIEFEVDYSRQEIDTSNVPLVFSYERPEPILVERWSANQIPAVDRSAYVSSVDDLRGKVRFLISEFGIPRQPLDNSWELVAAQIRRNADPEELLNSQQELKMIGQEIAGYFDTERAAQDSIFSYVNETVLYNELNTVFADGDLSHVLEGRPANQAEINMTLLALLKGACIESYPLYISGRESGRINRSFPSPYQFNRMLVHSRINGRNWAMDASFAFSEPDLIPIESYNEQGFILREESYEWIDITPEKSRFDLSITIDAELSATGDLRGTLSAVTKGYPAQEILAELDNGQTEREVAAGTFLEIYGSEIINSADIGSLSSENGGVAVDVEFLIEEYATSFSDGLEFRPMIVGYLFQNPFESTQRRVPITLDAPENLEINYNVRIPDGFSIEENSGMRDIHLSGAELREQYKTDGNSLEYSFRINISKKEFSADLYPELRRIYERWVELSNATWLIENQSL